MNAAQLAVKGLIAGFSDQERQQLAVVQAELEAWKQRHGDIATFALQIEIINIAAEDDS